MNDWEFIGADRQQCRGGSGDGRCCRSYGIALRYAPTPQAKDQVQRRHDDWPKRLPPLPAADPILEWCGAHTRLQPLLAHANEHEFQF